jgi:hypothetical protein
VIALVAYLVERGVNDPFLIAAPAAVVANWERELDAWLPSLAYVAYKGTADKRVDIFESQVRADRRLQPSSYRPTVSANPGIRSHFSFVRPSEQSLPVSDCQIRTCLMSHTSSLLQIFQIYYLPSRYRICPHRLAIDFRPAKRLGRELMTAELWPGGLQMGWGF